MKQPILTAVALALASAAAPALAQSTTVVAQPLSGTRLDISATGEATRVPDIAIISAGVVTRSATATAALEQNAARMDRVRAALTRAGIADRDIQTSNISLNPEYRYVENSRRNWSAIPHRIRSAYASATSAIRARFSTHWSRRAPIRSTGPT
jgi:uncharacterized protein YggE